MPLRFRPRLWSSLAAAAGIAATIALGFWQQGRAEQREAQETARHAAEARPPVLLGSAPSVVGSLEGQRIEAYGRFVPEGTVLLDNRLRSGTPGYEVVTPLQLRNSDLHVLVNRGWVKGSLDRRQPPALRTPEGEVHVTGLAVVPGRRFFELSQAAPQGKIWQNLTVERYRERMPYPILPIMIQQSNPLDDGLLREWPSAERRIKVHRSYALQWFGMAALIAALYVYYSLRRVPPQP